MFSKQLLSKERNLKISMGIWGNTNLRDRFNLMSGERGPEVTQLIIGAMMGGKPYERVRSKYSDEEWRLF